MGIIFGSGGIFSRNGNTTFSNDGDVMTDTGESTIGSNGSMTKAGDVSIASNGTISRAGNTYFSNGKTYTKIGNTLVSSDGKTWTGTDDMSDDDIRHVIFHENK